MFIVKNFKKKYQESFIEPKNLPICEVYDIETQKEDLEIANMFIENEKNMVDLAINVSNQLDCAINNSLKYIGIIKINQLKESILKGVSDTFISIAKTQYKDVVEEILNIKEETVDNAKTEEANLDETLSFER